MKIAFTRVDVSYACRELGIALIKAIPQITQVAKEYEGRNDDRTLVVVLTCPCCHGDGLLGEKGAVLVSPFRGIDPAGYNVHCVDKNPPFRNPGFDKEAKNLDEYLDSLRTTINSALL